MVLCDLKPESSRILPYSTGPVITSSGQTRGKNLAAGLCEGGVFVCKRQTVRMQSPGIDLCTCQEKEAYTNVKTRA